jgi:hypothetical protein
MEIESKENQTIVYSTISGVWFCLPKREMNVLVFEIMESSGVEYSMGARILLCGMEEGELPVSASSTGHRMQFIIIY